MATQGDYFFIAVYVSLPATIKRFFFRHICVDECGNIAPAVSKSKTKLDDLSSTLKKRTNLAYEFPPVANTVFLVLETGFAFLR